MVEPIKPVARKRLAKNLSEPELAEFEQLLSARFEVDPSRPMSAAAKKKAATREKRLRLLGRRVGNAQ